MKTDCLKGANIYGATVVHYRRAFTDQAVASRSITIETRYRDGDYRLPGLLVEGVVDVFRSIGEKIQFSDVGNMGTGRVYDVWRPLLAVAKFIKDQAWLDWAMQQIESEVENLRDGHAYELAGLMLAQIIECLSKDGRLEYREVKVRSDLTLPLRREAQVNITPWQAGQQLRELGFRTYRKGGMLKFTPTLQSLRQAADKIGYCDQILSEEQVMQNKQVKQDLEMAFEDTITDQEAFEAGGKAKHAK